MKLLKEFKEEYKVNSAVDVYDLLKEFEDEDREYFIVIGLNTKNNVIYRAIETIGVLDQTLLHPREIFKRAIIMSCNSIIIAHNHPSGELEPSEEDIKQTRRIVEVGELLQIPLLDHIIIGKDDYYSLKKEKNDIIWRKLKNEGL